MREIQEEFLVSSKLEKMVDNAVRLEYGEDGGGLRLEYGEDGGREE